MKGADGGPRPRYWLTLASGMVECLCFAGVLFGWASLVFVLKEEGYFGQYCEGSLNNTSPTSDCSRQDEQFSLVFTIGSFLNNFMTFTNGYIFDRFGTTVTRLLGIFFYTSGTLLVAFSSAALSVMLFPALACIGWEDFTAHNKHAVQSFRSCVLSWVFFWHLLWLSVMQLRHYLFIGTLNPTISRLADNDPDLVSKYTNAFAMTQLCGVLCAPWNGLIMDRNKGKPLAPGETEKEADLRSSVLSLFLTALQCLCFSICASIPVLPLQYLTFSLQVINRSFLYGGNAAFISVAFPACHFGKLYGLVMSLSAIVSLLQYPCFALVKGVLGGDPLYVDIALTILTLVAFVHPINVYNQCRKSAQKKAEQAEICQGTILAEASF
ncbi:hypothetical protein WMY93_006095 [Mugilogobius chulae]|uniref:Solute carrier family 43 member 3 n=1 Tax=Mugilogobius chulae TaxID=88201 RepID=A0AAW0PIN5_9GOBI